MNTAPEWMKTLESIDARGAAMHARFLDVDQRCDGHVVAMATNGNNVQDFLGRLLFRIERPCKPGDILSQTFQVTGRNNADAHEWILHYKVLAPVPFKEVQQLARYYQHQNRTKIQPRPGKWYEVHAD